MTTATRTSYHPAVGLETHVELSTATKLFCGCANEFAAPANTLTCPVCTGQPGALPVVNEQAVRAARRIGLALSCTLSPVSEFARKHYFYPDTPKNFQTSQHEVPLCLDGFLDVEVEGETFRVEIERVHLEEDAGKLTHAGGDGRIAAATHSLVDCNRAGVPLVEIVTRPIQAGARTAAVARAYVTELRELLRELGVSQVRMERGELRCDVNVSLAPEGELGTRTETKNVASLRVIERVVEVEVLRQTELLEAGGSITQETRHLLDDTGHTRPGRSKENADSYRYFPEPDLVPMAISPVEVEELRATIPAAPLTRRRELAARWGFDAQTMRAISVLGAFSLVEDTVRAGASPSAAKNWWTGFLAHRASSEGVEPGELAITPAEVSRLCVLVGEGAITDALARRLAAEILAGGELDALLAVHAANLDPALVTSWIDEALAADEVACEKVRAGELRVLGALIGAAVRASDRRLDPTEARRLILERLS